MISNSVNKYRGSANYGTSAIRAAQIYFNFGEYEKADFLIHEGLKKYPRDTEALYFEGLISFYLYKTSTGEVKKLLAAKTQNLLLSMVPLRS